MNKPTKPNIVIPESFAENGIKTDFDNEKLTNGFDRLQPDVLAGDNLNKLIDDTYKASNYALNLGDYVLGKNQITNCILEAPNGVATYSGSTITVKTGLKVLMPNGKNADGTLNNIEYTLESDYNHNPYIGSESRLLFISSNGVAFSYNKLAVTTSNHNPSTISAMQGLWYQPSENKWFETGDSGATWSEKQICYISQFSTNSTSIISLNNESTVELFKRQNRNEISGLGMPNNIGKKVGYSVGSSGSYIIAPANGVLNFGTRSNINYAFIRLTNITTSETIETASAQNNAYPCISINCNKADKIVYTYNTTDTVKFLQFIYANGEI